MNEMKTKFSLTLSFLFSFLISFCLLDGHIYEHSEVKNSVSGNIEGLVIDSVTNLPVMQAHVDVMRGNAFIASVLTDENGRYYVSGLSHKPHLFKVSAPHFQSSFQLGYPIPNQTISLDFALHYQPVEMQGRILNSLTAEPIGNALIEVLEEGLLVDSFQADENGSYMIPEITPKSYVFRISAESFRSSIQSIDLLITSTSSIDFALEPLGNVVGQVVHDFTKEPIVGASIGLWQNDALFASTSTDEKGYFDLKGLGNCQLVVKVSQFHDLEQSVQISSVQTTTLNFNLICLAPRPPRKIHGEVFYERYAHQINRVHRLKWVASPDPTVSFYRIYREEKRIGKVPATHSLVFQDKWRSEKKKTYQITAVDVYGQEGRPLSITIK
jgi:hypothetical protein